MKISQLIVAPVLSFTIFTAGAAGIPVADAVNLQQNLMDYIESLSQGVQQMTSYALQVRQYENEILRYDEMVKNRLAPAAYLYDRINNLNRELNNIYNGAEQIKRKYGDVEAYLSQYGDPSFYSGSACYNSGRCDLSKQDDYRTRLTQANLRYLREMHEQLQMQFKEMEERQSAMNESITSVRDQIKASDGGLRAQQAIGEAVVSVSQGVSDLTQEIRTANLREQKREYDRMQLEKMANEQAMSFIAGPKSFDAGQSWNDMFGGRDYTSFK